MIMEYMWFSFKKREWHDFKLRHSSGNLFLYSVHCLRKFKFTIVNTNILFLSESEEQQRIRFQTELEFVQCLANPNYLNCK